MWAAPGLPDKRKDIRFDAVLDDAHIMRRMDRTLLDGTDVEQEIRTDEVTAQAMERIVRPTLAALESLFARARLGDV